MVYPLLVAPPDSKANRLGHTIHDFRNVLPKHSAGHIQQDGLVTTSDVESNSARTDRVFVGDHSADWHGIAFVMVAHQRNLVGCLGTRLDLAQCAFIWRTPHRNVV